MSPRRNRRVPGAYVSHHPRGVSGSEQTESWPDGTWVVRRVSAATAVKTYRCPGCDQQIPPGVGHIVSWPVGTRGVEDRRHWHTVCWRKRLDRMPDIKRARNAPRYRGRRPPTSPNRETSRMEIRASTVLPARRTPVTLHTADGLRLVGELAVPEDRPPVATLICLHPLPTHGGMMDSHIIRKASYRLPALAGVAVLRFNTRGTASTQGRSEGEFGHGEAERYDVAAALEYVEYEGLPHPWLLGWSFGTELALKWGCDPLVEGAILLSPPLHRAGDADLDAWAASGKPVVVLVPELDDYLRPEEARARFARIPQAEVIAVEKAKHLWVGEPYVRIVLNAIVARIAPQAYPLPTHWPASGERPRPSVR